MSLQAEKQDLDTKINRYMTLLSNLNNPPAEYINDLDYFRGLVQIADQKAIDELKQTWETIRPKDARSAHYIDTGQINDGRAIQGKSAVDLAWDIIALRGGPTSGNWAHDGRPGERGGSGRGGGFGRIGVKNGKKAGRKRIKRAARQTRARDERERKGGGVGATGGDIPASVVSRAKSVVNRAKMTRDKELKIANKMLSDVEKSRIEAQKANDRWSASGIKLAAVAKKRNEAIDKAATKRKELESFLSNNPSLRDPKIRSKADTLSKQADFLQKKADKLNNDWISTGDKTTKLGNAFISAGDALIKARDEFNKSTKWPSQIITDFQKATEQESKILFRHNLNEAKKVRASLVKNSEEIRELDKRLETARNNTNAMRSFIKSTGKKTGDPSLELFSNELLARSKEENRIRKEVDKRKRELGGSIKVDNPTKIIQAVGTQKDKTLSFVVETQNRRKIGQSAFESLVSEDVMPKGTPVRYLNTKDSRSFHRRSTVSEVHMSSLAGADTVVHELGHSAENYNRRLLQRSIEWRNKRTEGEKWQKLSKVTGLNYDDGEVTKPDKFFDPYIGKDYKKSASEVFSMGIERMYKNPVSFAKEDPDMFDFIYATARTP